MRNGIKSAVLLSAALGAAFAVGASAAPAFASSDSVAFAPLLACVLVTASGMGAVLSVLPFGALTTSALTRQRSLWRNKNQCFFGRAASGNGSIWVSLP